MPVKVVLWPMPVFTVSVFRAPLFITRPKPERPPMVMFWPLRSKLLELLTTRLIRPPDGTLLWPANFKVPS